jgi:hypothetical protein
MSKYELIYRSTKGSPLTPDEIDTNFKRIKNGHDSIDNSVTKLDQVVNVTYKNQIAGLSSQISQFEGRVSTLRVDVDKLIDEGLANITVKVDLENYYDKSEVDQRISELDAQNLQLDGTLLSISNGNSVDLSSIDTDSQTLTLTGNTLQISGGNSVDLSGTGGGLNPDSYYTKTEVDDRIFSRDYNDLTNKPTIPVVPTNVSAFTNDAGYLTEHQDLSLYALKTELFSGDYNDLTNKPYTPTQELISEIQTDISTNKNDIFDLKIAVAELGGRIPIPTPQITITPSVSTVNEVGEVSNQVVTFIVTTANTYEQDSINWSISGTNINTDDFSSVTLSSGGNTPTELDISSLSGTISNPTLTHELQVTIARDEKSEGGNEVFVLNIAINRDNQDPVTENRSVTIIDNSTDSIIKAVSWPGPAPSGPPTLFDHLRNTTETNMWVQDFDLSALKITPTEEAQIISDALSEDYTSMINLGFKYEDIEEVITLSVPEIVTYMNGLVDTMFGSGNTLIIDDGVSIFGTYDSDTLELRSSTNRLYIRNESPAFTGVIYSETYNLSDLRAVAETEVDKFLENFDWVGKGFSVPTEEQLTQIKDVIMAFMDVILPIAINVSAAMSTTLNLYGYRKLTPGS